jgi:hypothetical protein
MNMFLLATDPSGLGAMWDSLFWSSFGGNYVFWGLLLVGAFIYFAIMTRMRSGSVVVAGTGLIYMLTIFDDSFRFLFYLAIIVSVIVFIMGIKNKTR